MREFIITFAAGGVTFASLIVGGMLLQKYVFGPHRPE